MTVIEQTLRQSVVDDEFRSMLMANPAVFGVDAATALPRPVEAHQSGLTDFALAAIDMYACNNTCSWGFTVVCDKFTN